jgi:hypothetical protein
VATALPPAKYSHYRRWLNQAQHTPAKTTIEEQQTKQPIGYYQLSSDRHPQILLLSTFDKKFVKVQKEIIMILANCRVLYDKVRGDY